MVELRTFAEWQEVFADVDGDIVENGLVHWHRSIVDADRHLNFRDRQRLWVGGLGPKPITDPADRIT